MPRTAKKDDISTEIVTLKDSGKTWAQVADIVGMPTGKTMFAYYVATVTPKTRITGKTDEELNQKIASAREDGLSWGQIAARSGKSEGYCRKAFEEITGKAALGDRSPGKGGRFPGSTNGAAKPAKKASKAAPVKKSAVKKAAKKAPAKKAAKKKAAKATA